MVYVRTTAYNAEMTIERTIQSILNQTYSEFRYYILENGSTDGTREIIKKYAEQDQRIVPFYGDINNDRSINKEFFNMLEILKDDDFFCTIDADDYYEVTFLEEMLAFMREYELGFAACGSRFEDGETGETCGDRVLDGNIVLTNAEHYDKGFPIIHWNLRQTWGKVYTGKVARARYENILPEDFPKGYGTDTANIYECVKASERIGVYGKCLHTYTVSHKSVSYRWTEGREYADFMLYEKAVEVLKKKCGYVSPENQSFLCAVQFSALRDTLAVLKGVDLPVVRKIEILKFTFENEITKKAFIDQRSATKDEKTELLTRVICWLIEMAQEVESSVLMDVLTIITCINVKFNQLIAAECFEWFVKNTPVIVRNVALGEYEYAVNNLIVYVARKKDENLAVDHPFVLGQVLASLRGEAPKYVFFSKQLIQWCIEHGQKERARRDLEEWLQILPEDNELIEWSSMC